jgi:hypothetical protein
MLKTFARSVTPRAAGVLLLLIAITATLAASAAATPKPQPPSRIGGITRPFTSPHVQGSGDLLYHGGPVMTTNKVYAIYWLPSGYTMGANYQSTINQYFTDVAHDSGMSTNVYASDTQYSSIQYNSTFGGSAVDTNPFPAKNPVCNVSGLTTCLTDSQIYTEIGNVIASQGWTKNLTTQFFMFTPRDVASCFNDGSGCSFTAYCAYHGYVNGFIYANQPYTVSSVYPGSCDEHQYPNSSDADPTINVTSHEHNEAITDPQLSAWWDAAGYENGDKCAWDFGSVSGPNGGEYNQTINGNHYFLQREYSNDGHACVQTYNIQGGNQPTVTSFLPTSGPVGTQVDVQGTNFTGATSVTFNGTSDPSFVFNSSTDITAHVPTGATTGPIAVTTPSGTGTSSANFTVTGGGGNPPTVTSFTPTSGPVGTNVSITGTNFTGATTVKFNTTAATSFTVNSSTNIHATVPTGATTGHIAVTTPNGTGTSVSNFTVTTSSGAPKITSFSPTYGRSGLRVTILGSNFTGSTSVKLGGTSSSFTVYSANRIYVTVPVKSPGRYTWSVTNAAGTGTSTGTFFHL